MAFVDTLNQSITPLYMPQGNFFKNNIAMRRKEKVDNLNRLKLQNLEHSQYANYVLAQFKTLNLDKLNEVLPPLVTAIKNEDAVLNLPASAAETVDVRQLDDVRDKAFRSLSLKVQTALVSDDADERAAAKKVERVLDCYPGLPSMNYEKETGALLNLIVDLKDAKLAAEVTKLALTSAIARLETANTEFSKTYYGRYASNTDAPKRGARALRERTDEVLDDVLWRAECLYEVTRGANLLRTIELHNTYVADREKVFADRERTNAAAEEAERKRTGEMLAPLFLALEAARHLPQGSLSFTGNTSGNDKKKQYELHVEGSDEPLWVVLKNHRLEVVKHEEKADAKKPASKKSGKKKPADDGNNKKPGEGEHGTVEVTPKS